MLNYTIYNSRVMAQMVLARRSTTAYQLQLLNLCYILSLRSKLTHLCLLHWSLAVASLVLVFNFQLEQSIVFSAKVIMHISVFLSFLLGIYVGSAYNPGGFMCSLCSCTQRNLYCENISSRQINYTLNGKPLGFDMVYFRNIRWVSNTTINCGTFLGSTLLDFGKTPCLKVDTMFYGDDCLNFKKSTKIICEKPSSSTTTTSSTSTTFTSPEATKAQTSPTTVLPSTSNETNTTVTTSTSTHSPFPLPRSSSTSSTPNDNSTPFSFPSRTNLTFTLSVISFSIIIVCLVILLFIIIYRKCRKCSVTVQQNINRNNVRYNRLNQSVDFSPHSSRPRAATAARVLEAVENPLTRQPRGTEFLMAPIIATTGQHGQWPGSPPVVREETQVDRSEREDAQSSSNDSINSNCSFLSQSLVVKKELDKKNKFETGARVLSLSLNFRSVILSYVFSNCSTSLSIKALRVNG